MVKILSIFVAFLENMNFKNLCILQARNVQKCTHANDKCREKEVLQKELQVQNGQNGINGQNDLNGQNGEKNRYLINEEYVESLDESDGSKPYDEKTWAELKETTLLL